MTRRLLALAGAAAVLTGIVAVKAGRWLLSFDPHDVDDDPTTGGEPVSDEIHCTPVDDLIEHDTHEDCICGPRAEAVFRDDGSNGWLYVHHALDNREAHE